MTIEELAVTGLRGKDLAEAIYTDMFGCSPAKPDLKKTPEERRAPWDRFFSLMRSITEEELAEDPWAGRPLNVSILVEQVSHDADAA
jgi:hypothetical protein